MELLRTSDVALRLGVIAVYVRQLADAGKLPVLKTVGGFRLFRSEDVEKLRRQREERERANTTRTGNSK